jgi:hypothetical protein
VGGITNKRKTRGGAYAVARRLGVIGCDEDPRTDVARRHAEYVRVALRARASAARRRTARG